jgi:hypothetical protein
MSEGSSTTSSHATGASFRRQNILDARTPETVAAQWQVQDFNCTRSKFRDSPWQTWHNRSEAPKTTVDMAMWQVKDFKRPWSPDEVRFLEGKVLEAEEMSSCSGLFGISNYTTRVRFARENYSEWSHAASVGV